jgi:serine/threonine-protein kinase
MKNWSHVDTLAAAYAEAGSFDEAIKYQQKAIELAPADKKETCQKRLALYQDNQPWRTDVGK